MRHTTRFLVLAISAGVAVTLLLCEQARAVPSFARQTGMACDVCHTTFPQLTPFGRHFKMVGYTITAEKEVKAPSGEGAPLELGKIVPLSFMAQASFTHLNDAQPDTQNDDVQFPQQLSLFLAGEIAGSVGSFLQVTYTGEDDHFGMDNTDIRYARNTSLGGKGLIYGVTLNNNPTVEDPWNSTPAWGFPWATSDTAPAPTAAALVDGGLAQDVAGLGAYTMWNNHLYMDATVYRSEHIGGDQPPDQSSENTIKGVAPYWRLAWQQNWSPNYLEVGTYGLYASLYPEGISGDTDKYTDLAFDFQYERTVGSDLLTVRATYIYEQQNLDATHAAGGAENTSNHLHTFRVNSTYNWRNRTALTLAYFLLRGSEDQKLYAPAEVTGSANGSPDSDGFVAELGFFPWQNLRLSLQYTSYLRFNGRTDNYDGFGRDASDNDTLYALAWLMW